MSSNEAEIEATEYNSATTRLVIFRPLSPLKLPNSEMQVLTEGRFSAASQVEEGLDKS